MTRRIVSALLAAILALAPFPARSQVGRVTLEVPVTPTISASGSAINGASFTPSVAAGLTPSLALALTPLLAAPAAQPLPQPTFAAMQPVSAAEPIIPIAQIVPAQTVVRKASNDDRATLIKILAEVSAAPANLPRLYDAAPAAPDFERLSSVKTPAPPATWVPGSVLLKPAAAVVNAWRLSRYEKRLNSRGPGERVTTEELGLQDTLSDAHESIATGRLQDALGSLTKLFQGREVNGWYRANSVFQPYQFQGHAYIRFIERAVKLAYERAHERARDSSLVAEARFAASTGRLLGHEWRTTAIQDRDSAHCAHHALFNAIQASVGFVYPLSVHRFIERARETLNVKKEKVTDLRGAELAALENSLGISLGKDVGEGMGTGSIVSWAKKLGLGVTERGPPHGDLEWSSLLGGGREVLLSLRMFHERFKHTPDEASLHGNDYKMLHHEVYLLGAFDSPSRGVRLYMVQDSGSGSTDFYTAEELSAVASDLQVITTPAPVDLR
jgi:hypothetical protein